MKYLKLLIIFFFFNSCNKKIYYEYRDLETNTYAVLEVNKKKKRCII